MNHVDQQYLENLKCIINSGTCKETRSGSVHSMFGVNMRFNLSDGFPLLLSKRMYYKGIIHELLWFLKGSTNIRYLLENNVHIWDADAYRWYSKTICPTQNVKPVDNLTFNELVLRGESIDDYTYGDLGPVYGKQWRDWDGVDQIASIIDKLKNNPDDRRIILNAWNVGQLSEMALPPCHIYYQFYSREMSQMERLDYLCDNNGNKYDEFKYVTKDILDSKGVPERALSCMLVCRSQDFPLGTPYNIASVAFLTHMIAEVTNHVPDEIVYVGGDCHVYENQVECAYKQLKQVNKIRHKSLPKLSFARKVTNIDDFKYEDFIIENYNSSIIIKYPLSVG